MEAKRTATALVLFLCTAFLLWWAATSFGVGSGAFKPSAAVSSYMVVVRHSMRDDAHVYTGSIESSGCQTLATGVQTEGIEPVRLKVRLERVASTSCSSEQAEQISKEPFSIAIESGAAVPRLESITVDGKEASFTVLED